MDNVEKYQQQLLDQTRKLYRETPVSAATENAYLATPRHCFVRRYREWGTREWREVTPDNLTEHLASTPTAQSFSSATTIRTFLQPSRSLRSCFACST